MKTMDRILLFIGRNWLALWVCVCTTAMVYLIHNHSNRMVAAQAKPAQVDTVYMPKIDTLYAPESYKEGGRND